MFMPKVSHFNKDFSTLQVTSDEDRDSSSEEESRPVKSTMKSKSSKLKVGCVFITNLIRKI